MPPRSTSTARCTWPTASLTQVEQALHLLNTIPVKPNGTPSEWQLVTASDAPDVRHPQWGLIVTWCPPASNTRRFFNVRHHRNASGIGRVGAEPLRGGSDRTTATQLTVAIRDALRGILFYKMLYWINWIVLLSLEPLAGELEYASFSIIGRGLLCSSHEQSSEFH